MKTWIDLIITDKTFSPGMVTRMSVNEGGVNDVGIEELWDCALVRASRSKNHAFAIVYIICRQQCKIIWWVNGQPCKAAKWVKDKVKKGVVVEAILMREQNRNEFSSIEWKRWKA